MVSLRNSASFGGKRRTVKIGCDCLYAISPPEAGRSNEKGDLAICNTTRVWLPCCAPSPSVRRTIPGPATHNV